MACEHSGYHSGGARYMREESQLALALICDSCGAERAQLGRIDYTPPAPLDTAAGTQDPSAQAAPGQAR